MACEDIDPTGSERVELRWLRPDGREAVSVTMRYANITEAMAAVAAVFDAFEEVRRAGTGSSAVGGTSPLESDR